MTDIKDIKEGDVVLVRVTVVDTYSTWILTRDGAGNIFDVPLKSIVSVEPAPLKVGDRVRGVDPTQTAEILCIDGEHAGVRWLNGGRTWPLLCCLERA